VLAIGLTHECVLDLRSAASVVDSFDERATVKGLAGVQATNPAFRQGKFKITHENNELITAVGAAFVQHLATTQGLVLRKPRVKSLANFAVSRQNVVDFVREMRPSMVGFLQGGTLHWCLTHLAYAK